MYYVPARLLERAAKARHGYLWVGGRARTMERFVSGVLLLDGCYFCTMRKRQCEVSGRERRVLGEYFVCLGVSETSLTSRWAGGLTATGIALALFLEAFIFPLSSLICSFAL